MAVFICLSDTLAFIHMPHCTLTCLNINMRVSVHVFDREVVQSWTNSHMRKGCLAGGRTRRRGRAEEGTCRVVAFVCSRSSLLGGCFCLVMISSGSLPRTSVVLAQGPGTGRTAIALALVGALTARMHSGRASVLHPFADTLPFYHNWPYRFLAACARAWQVTMA